MTCGRRRLYARVAGANRRHVAARRQVSRELDAVIAGRSKPRTYVSDNSTEQTVWTMSVTKTAIAAGGQQCLRSRIPNATIARQSHRSERRWGAK
jgi:hypothetical protein